VGVEGNWRRRRVEPVSRMGEIDRRTFVMLSGASAAALVFGAGPFTERALARARFTDYPFKLGVSSGDLPCRTASCSGHASHLTPERRWDAGQEGHGTVAGRHR
jgi:hypothetical protein